VRWLAMAALLSCTPVDNGLVPGMAGPVVLPLYVDGDDDDAGDWWNEFSPVPLFERGGAPGADEFGWVYVRQGFLPPGIRGIASVVTSPRGEVLWCDVTIDDVAPEVYRHELGHCLGLADDPRSLDLGSIMSNPTMADGEPTGHDVECVLRGCDD